MSVSLCASSKLKFIYYNTIFCAVFEKDVGILGVKNICVSRVVTSDAKSKELEW